MALNRFRREDVVPALARESLRRGEKVLAACPTVNGGWLVGTADALVVTVDDATTRIPWEQVERADWDRDSSKLRVRETGQFGRVRPEHVFEVEDPNRLLQLVRERVTASLVLQRRVSIEPDRGLVVVARRAPTGRGPLTWAYEFDANTDPDDPLVVEAAERGLRVAAEEVGL